MDKKKNKLQIRNSTAEFLIFTNQDGKNSIEVRVEEETVWLNRHQITTLFGRNVKTIGKHINNVFAENELKKGSTIANFAIVSKYQPHRGNTFVDKYYESNNSSVGAIQSY